MRKSKLYIFIILCSTIGFFGCSKFSNELPVANFSLYPESGDVNTVFIFNADESHDEETENWRLKVRWDNESDGVWDSDFSIEKLYACKFENEGEHEVTMEILDSYGGVSRITKSISVGPVIIDSVMLDPRDQQEYAVVQLLGKWWMAENLRYGEVLQSEDRPKDNLRAEFHRYSRDSIMSREFGSFYTWNEATNYQKDIVQGVCPDGWHILNYEEFLEINDLLRKISDKYNFYGPKGSLHLNFPLTGRYFWPLGQWDQQSMSGYFWVSKELPFSSFSPWGVYGEWNIKYMSDFHTVAWQSDWKMEWGEFSFQKISLPVRCVKDSE